MLRMRAIRYGFSCLLCDPQCGAPGRTATSAALAQLADHALRARMAAGSIPAGKMGGLMRHCDALRFTLALHFGASARRSAPPK